MLGQVGVAGRQRGLHPLEVRQKRIDPDRLLRPQLARLLPIVAHPRCHLVVLPVCGLEPVLRVSYLLAQYLHFAGKGALQVLLVNAALRKLVLDVLQLLRESDHVARRLLHGRLHVVACCLEVLLQQPCVLLRCFASP